MEIYLRNQIKILADKKKQDTLNPHAVIGNDLQKLKEEWMTNYLLASV